MTHYWKRRMYPNWRVHADTASLLQGCRQPTNCIIIILYIERKMASPYIYTADHPRRGSQGKSDTPRMFDLPDTLEDHGVALLPLLFDDDDDCGAELLVAAADHARCNPHAISTPMVDLGPKITRHASRSMRHCLFSKLKPNTSNRSEEEPLKKLSTLLLEGSVVPSSITTSPSAVILRFGMVARV
mmetsp:Transcript_1267/g.1766  ORF Transcript_1267/g.1766 Transcript_1267/m.1766 type:complete len:186 (-) Transcript_1267:137-694(-)